MYSEVGWASFNFEGVARRSGVGKPAIYLRWATKEELLLDAFGILDLPHVDTDTGSLEGDLMELGLALLDWWMSTGARAWQRLQLDSSVFAELSDTVLREHMRRNVRAAEAIVDRALLRGDIDDRAGGIIVLEMVNGAIFTRIFDTPPDRRDAFREKGAAYVRRLAMMAATAATIRD